MTTDNIVELVLERRTQQDKTAHVGAASITPPIDEGYWAYRVRLTEKQAIVGFPKFGTVGIGFAVEEDWNTNLPYTCGTDEIRSHILHNKGDDAISDEDVRSAILMVQAAVWQDQGIEKLVELAERLLDPPSWGVDRQYAKRILTGVRTHLLDGAK